MRRRGLSLIEILIASVLLVATLVPMWGLMGASHRQITISSDEIRASQIALEIIEQIENSGWFPQAGDIHFTPVANGAVRLGGTSGIEVQIGEFPEYFALKGRIEVDGFPASGANSGRVVRVILFYTPREVVGEQEKSYQVSTFINRL